ncbi:MAG: hypothetical protein IKU82_03325 [Clostridia bacterium]|nr:hypothetical protein [Clostridia bacterium]
MNFKISFKRIVCLLIAAAMVVTVIGCSQKTTNKKKKVIKKKVVIVQSNDDVQDNTNNLNNDNVNTNDKINTLKPREIPGIKTKTEKYKEVFTPEFESKNVDWAGPDGYTIVYDSDAVENRVLANKLATFFKDGENVILSVKADTDSTIVNDGKLILIGDTAFKTSKLKETEFAVTLLDNGNLFFEGGHNTMVEKAVDWFRTVERVEGKVATLTGTQDDFTSKVTVLGKDYVYVWGDEFDGDEFMDTSKWGQRMRNEYSDLKIVHNDPHFQYVENGRLRISVDRYFDPADGDIGWGAHGSCNSYGDMIFQNGYLEMKVRFDYGQGSFPALWLMTDSSPLERYVPNYEQYSGRYFNLETDIFEFFGKGTHAAANMHKWYDSSKAVQIMDEDGNPTKLYTVYGVNGVELTDYIKNGWSGWGQGRYSSFSWEWRDLANTFNFSEEESKTLYKDYHLYQMIYTPESVKFGIDNNWYCEWPLEVAFDYIDGIDPTNNNNGVGMNFWHYLFLDQYVYPPSRAEEKGADAVITIDSAPLDSYVDYVRLYQLPDQIAIITSAGVGME